MYTEQELDHIKKLNHSNLLLEAAESIHHQTGLTPPLSSLENFRVPLDTLTIEHTPNHKHRRVVGKTPTGKKLVATHWTSLLYKISTWETYLTNQQIPHRIKLLITQKEILHNLLLDTQSSDRPALQRTLELANTELKHWLEKE